MKSKTTTSVLPYFRSHNKTVGSMICAMMGLWQVAQPLSAANITWNAESDTNFNWQDAANWDLGVPTLSDAVILPWVIPNPGALLDPSTLTLGASSEAGSVIFKNNYKLTGGILTLGSQGLNADLGTYTVIDSTISGSNGLVKTGGGSIRLNNTGNNFTGITSISDGSLIISGEGALGSDPSTISILSTNRTPLNNTLYGYEGGSLVLDGSSAGFTFSRNINFEGRGPIGERGSAILSLGDNTLSGVLSSPVSPLPLSPTATFRNSRINSVNGTLTLSGTLNVGGTVLAAGTTGGTTGSVLNLGGVNAAGIGDYNLSGVLAGASILEKSGAGTLFLNPSSSSGFTGAVRVSGSSSGQQSTVRVTQLFDGGTTSVFGANAVASQDAASIDMNGGVLEFRNDGNLDFGSLSAGKNVYLRANSTFYTGPAAGGSGINGVTTLGTFRVNANTTATFSNRNGFGMTFGAWTQEAVTNPNTITNNMGGTLTFTGDAWGNNDTTVRALTFGGNGNTTIVGNLIASGALHTLTKGGTGNLAIRGVASTITGAVSITGGAIQITDFRSLNNASTAAISLGNATTTGGNLIIGGTGVAPTAAGLTTSRPITLNTTSGSNSIYANQTGTSPVILNGAITKIAAATTGGLILGGTNTADNIINVIVPIEPTANTGGLTKLGSGTWVLNAANTYGGATTLQEGTLKLRATAAASNVIPEAAGNTIVFSAQANTQTAGGTLEFRGFAGAATTETLGALTPTAGAATIRLVGNGAAANLTFTSLGATTAASSVNFDTTAASSGVITLTGQAATLATNLPGTTNFLGHLYINGANFAAINASAQVFAPIYGTTTGFVNGGSALTSANHNLVNAAIASQAAVTVSSLKMTTNNLTMGGNLTLSTGALLQTGGSSTLDGTGGARLLLGAAAATNIAIRVDGTTDVLTLGSNISIGSTQTGGLTKNGAGTLVIQGTNAQTGISTINEGTVRLSGANARLSANGGTAAALVIRQGAKLELDGVTAANATFNNNLDGAGIITNINASPATIQIQGAGTWNGVFQDGTGVLNVTKGGTTGAPTWSGLNTYTGVTTIAGTTGAVTVDFLANGGQPSGIGASTSAASNLVFSGTTGGLIYRGNITDGALVLGSRSASMDRLFTLAGTAVGSGASISSTTANNNALVWSSMDPIAFGPGAAAQTLILTGTSTGDNTFNPQLTDNGVNVTSLTKQGAGQWNMGNTNNTYTGITTVNEGIFGLNQNGALPANSPLVLAPTSASSAAIFQMSGLFERTLAATATAGAGTVTFGGAVVSTTGGAGFAAHSTPLVVSIGGEFSPTSLVWGSGGFVGTGAVQNLVLNSTTALSSVDFRNAIDLGTSARTINVLDNGNTGADYANISGNLSGTGSGGIVKIGTGVLRLTGANSYTGTTAVEDGTLVVSSLGSSSGSATSSVGASGVAMGNSNAIVLGNATTTAGILQYVGPGETSNRKIRLRGTTAGSQIHADGSGPLVLTNVAHDTTETGSKTLSLRGTNTAGNMITSQLSNNGTGVLSVTVDGGATWILTNPASNYTGTTTVGSGALGIVALPAFQAATSATGAEVAIGSTSYTVGSTTGLLVGQAFSGTNVPAGSTIISIDGPTSFTASAAPTVAVTSGTSLTFAAAQLSISNGNVFAYGADRAFGGTLNLGNNASSGFIGDYSLTFNGTNNLAANANNLNVFNSIAAGKALTLNGLLANSLTDTRAWTIGGNGETVINGGFTTTTGFGVNILKEADGTLTLGTNGATSNWNQAGSALDVDRGTLKFTANNAIPTTFGAASTTASSTTAIGSNAYTVASTTGLVVGQVFTGTNVPAGSRIASITGATTFTSTTTPTTAVASGTALSFLASTGLTLSPELATGDTSVLDLNGTTQTINALTATTDGTVIINNTSATAAAFRFGANNSTVAFGTGAGNYSIQNLGDGKLDIVKLGNTSTTFGTAISVGNKGTLASEGGGSFILAGPVTAATGLRAIEASTLSLTGSMANPGLITSVEVGGGSTLGLVNGAGSAISNLTTLRLGNSGSGTATLSLNVGDLNASGDNLNTDTLSLLTGGALNLGNSITFNMTDAGLNPGQTYTLLNLADGGLTAFGAGNILQGATPGGFTSMTWTVTDNLVQLTTGSLIVGDVYWRGLTNATWNGAANNWSTDKAGALAAASIPGQGNTVRFAWDGVGTTALTTTLEQNFKVNALAFESGTTTPSSVAINPGALTTARLEVAPQVSTDGIMISAGAPAAVSIGTVLRLGANQTWSVADAGSLLTISGSLSGEKNVTKAGAGRVVLSAAADTSFNTGRTSVFTVSAGNLEFTNSAALGTTASNNVARVVVNGGGYYYNNATAGTAATLPHAIELNGGTLSGAGNNHTYGGPITISGSSRINMADSNGPATNTVRNITLSGAVSGTGNLTIDSNNTDSAGNQLGGTLTINNAAGSWAGDLALNRGTVTIAAAASPTVTPANVTFNSFGRFILQGVDGQTLNRAGALNYAAGAVGEFQVDNTTTTQATNFTVNQNGLVTLGASGTGASVRVALPDAFATMNITGGITLGGNSSISVSNAATRLLTISSIINDGANSYSLAINDDAGGWAQTNGTVLLDAANTYDGGTFLASGTLILGNKDAIGAGPLTVSGASIINSLVDRTGADLVANRLNLGAVLTFGGSNGFAFNDLTTNIGAGGITNSLTAGNLSFNQVNLAESAAAAARTLTIAGAGTGLTAITTLVNNDQNNILANNMTGSTLMIGTVAISNSAAVGRTLELGGSGNTMVTGLIEDVAGGGGLAGTLQKTGTGTLSLQGTNTFTGPVNVNGGNLDFSTVTNVGGTGSNLGAGSAINLGGGTLRFIGNTSQTTNRSVTATAASTLNTSGSGGAEISYTGAINLGGFQLTLTGALAANAGNLSGGITQTGTTSDLLVNSGTWNLTGTNTFADDIIVTGTTAILNLNAAGTLGFTAGTSNGLYSRDGGVININTANASGVANSGSLDFILIADTPSGAAATLNMASGSSVETPRLDVGSTINPGRTGNVTGTGLITVTSTGTDYANGIRFFDGSITADLSGVASMLKQGTADFTVSGNNSGLTGTVAATRIDAGNLILDYTTQNNNKISAAAALDMRGGRLTLNGNNSAATAQSVGSFTLANGGSNTIAMNPGAGQGLVLNLGAMTRAASAGTLRVLLPTGTQDATNGVTTTTAVNSNGSLGGFLTVTDATGTYFAAKSGNNIVPVTPTVASDVSTWTSGQNVTDTGSAYFGVTGMNRINSLSFNHTTGGTVTLANTATVDLFSGGALVTSRVTAGAPTITGGRLNSSIADLIVTHDGSTVMSIHSQIGLNNGVTKTGDGILRINSALNNYTGSTQILAGTLQVSGGNAIGNTSSVVLSDDRASTLELLANETIGNLSGGNAGTSQIFGTVALGSNTLSINSTTSVTYAGVFTGSGSIVRNGSSGVGNLFFTGNSGAGFTGSLVVNGGLVYVEGGVTMNASSLTVNKGGSFLISNNGTTRSGTRFLDTMPIILNSADGAWNSETRPSGLAIRTDQNATTNETVGLLTLASGASYFRGDASGTTGVAGIIASDITRSNFATFNARGRALGAITGDRNFVRIATGTASETAFAAALVGGAGAAASKNISILPWGIGEVTTATLADANMGNSLLTYVVNATSGAGLRPLDLATEYNTFATKTANTDNIRESLAADLTGIAGQSINALVLNNSNTATGSINVTGTGAAQTLAVTSGTMLFTATAAVTGTPAMGINLAGFDGGITVGSTNEYVFFVQNPTSAAAGGTVTATVSSPLASTADITKSGRGTLILTTANTAGGGSRRTTLNEGILEIADLDNIGGNTGALVFAGGTLRLGATLTDDISTRTISFLNAGGTIDTNNVNLALANSVGSGVGGFTKAGLGTLTLGVASTYTGTTTISGGTLLVNANNATGGGGALAIGAGATLDIGTRSINHNTVTTTGASPIIAGTGTISSSGGFNFTHTGDTTIDAILAGAGGLFKNQTNILTLNGASTYTGGTEIQNGTVAVNVLANAGVASSLGAPAAGTDASVIRLGLTTATTGLNYVGATNGSTNRILAMQGTTGGVNLNGNGIGAVDFAGGVVGSSTGAKTLTLAGTSATTVVNRITGITDGIAASITLAKSGANLWEVYGASSYTGGTQINDGTLQIANDNALPIATTVRLGTGTTAGTFDLNGFNQTIASLLVQTNSNTVTNNIVVDTGKTLTVNGAVTIGVNADNSDTNLTASGGGSIVVNSGGAGFQIGGATGTTNENRVDVDFTGISNFTANLGAGIFRLGDVTSSSGTAAISTFKLAANNTITAASIRVGDGSGPSDIHLLTLGNGMNVFNTDTLNVGSAGASIRSGGSIVFDVADTAGQFTLRASDGASRAILNLINTTGNTAGNMDAILNVAGHTANILASTVTLATRSLGTGATSATFSFDQGSLDITTLNMASRTSTGTGGATAVLNLGDSVATGTPVTTIGSINMAVNTSAGGAVEADINITGGIVNIGTGTGTAINMANAGTGRTVTSDITLTGGTVEVMGSIVRSGGAGVENATLTLNGAMLDLNGNSIGSSGAQISFAAQSGTLTNLAELNGGGLLTKTTPGVLIMSNGNTYTGGTSVTGGTVTLANTTGSATGSGSFTSAASTLVTGAGSILAAVNKNISFGGSVNIGNLSDTSASQISVATSGTGTLALNGDIFFDLFGGYNAGSLNASTNNDALVIAGANGFTIGAGANLRVASSVTPDGSWVAGSSWRLFDWTNLTGGVTGSFSNLPTLDGNFTNLPDLSSFNLSWDVSQLYTLGTITIVPEPGRALLVWLGLMLCFFRRRRPGF